MTRALNFNASSAILMTIAITEGIGIITLLIATALSGSLLRVKLDPAWVRTKTNSHTSAEADSSSEPS